METKFDIEIVEKFGIFLSSKIARAFFYNNDDFFSVSANIDYQRLSVASLIRVDTGLVEV